MEPQTNSNIDHPPAGTSTQTPKIPTSTGAAIIVSALKAESVTLSFGIPGTHNIELYDSLETEDAMRPVLITDEQSAGFMADGAFRAGSELAALNLVPGAGLTHAMSGIAECYMDQIPAIVLLCEPRHDVDFKYQLHDIDQCAMVAPISKKVFRPTNHNELYYHIRQAAREARTAPFGPTVVAIPAELYFKTGPVNASEYIDFLPSPSPIGIHQGRLQEVIDELNRSKNIGIYMGLGAKASGPAMELLADKLDALVFTSISGKGVFPENNPRFVWNNMGRALPKRLKPFDKQLDCLLAIGCRFGEVATASYGFEPPERFIHVDIDPDVFHQNFRAKLTLQADSKDFVDALLQSASLLEHQPDDAKRLELEHEKNAIVQEQTLHRKKAKGIIPADLYRQFQAKLGPKAVYVCDSGNGTFMAMESLKLEQPDSFLAPVDFSCMGYAVPAAIGAKLAAPEKPVVATVGDGAFLMTGLEMKTAVDQQLGIIFCILNDGKLSQIAQFQKNALAKESLTELNPIDFSSLAKAVNMPYVKADQYEELDEAIAQALDHTKNHRPVLLDIAIDYSKSTFFTQGVVKTNFARLAWKDRIRMGSRLLQRKLKH